MVWDQIIPRFCSTIRMGMICSTHMLMRLACTLFSLSFAGKCALYITVVGVHVKKCHVGIPHFTVAERRVVCMIAVLGVWISFRRCRHLYFGIFQLLYKSLPSSCAARIVHLVEIA